VVFGWERTEKIFGRLLEEKIWRIKEKSEEREKV